MRTLNRFVYLLILGLGTTASASSQDPVKPDPKDTPPQPVKPAPEAEPPVKPTDVVTEPAAAAAVEVDDDAKPEAPETEPAGEEQPPAKETSPADDNPLRDVHTRALRWRHLGPVNPVGRIVDFEVVTDQPRTWYAATASGGLFKTTNAGTTWDSLFDSYATVSLGDVAVAPSNPDIVWVGTGEENGRNSVSWGDGVYKSTNGGKTFTHMGLPNSFQIGHIAIHPANADIVFVAALGALWGQNEERGLFRTVDGGETWEHVLYIDDRTGCIDVRIHPEDPSVVWTATYERSRDQFDGNDPAVRFGANAGIWRSIDGGNSFEKLTNGLPTCKFGRVGLSV